MNILTERILARYVGTGVRVRRTAIDTGMVFKDVELTLEVMGWILTAKLTKYQLILRPLSDLTKPCLVGGKVPIEVLYEMRFPFAMPKDGKFNISKFTNEYNSYFQCTHNNTSNYIFVKDIQTDRNEHWITEQLHLWHFDTSNLIEQGLAIDINTITKE